MHRTDRGEIAFVGEVRPLADVDRTYQLRNQEIQVGVSLPVRVGAHVDRHTVDRNRQIGTVIQVKATQKILVGFAIPAVLRHHQSRNGLKNFARARHRPCVQVFAGNCDLACHVRRAHGSRTCIRCAGRGRL